MPATDEQLARVQTLLDTCDDWDDEEQAAVEAVLAELTTLRGLRDAVRPGFDGILYVIRLSPMDATRREEWDGWTKNVKAALAKCKETSR